MLWALDSNEQCLSVMLKNLFLIGTDGSQSSGISVVRVGHEGRPDDATDSENEDDDKIPHVTLTVDSYYNEPNSIIKYGKLYCQSLTKKNTPIKSLLDL